MIRTFRLLCSPAPRWRRRSSPPRAAANAPAPRLRPSRRPSPFRPRRSRASPSIASCASPARSPPTSRPTSPPKPPAASSARRSSAARASPRARSSIRISATEADASLREADANAAQLEARLGLAAASRSIRVERARRPEREGVARLGGGGLQPHQGAARSEGRLAGRVRPAADAGRRPRGSSTRRRRTARSSRSARCRPRAPASISRASPPPTRSSARRSPASSPSASSAPATT